jgi:predicted SAM-dependent methyltransferase
MVKGMKLNIGCGNHIIPGYINIDVRKLPGVDMVYKVTEDPLPFEDNSIEHIYLSHIIEHLYPSVCRNLLSECYRVLFINGILEITSPDIIASAIRYSMGEINYSTLRSLFYGNREEYPENQHYFGYSGQELEGYLKSVGFKEVRRLDSNINLKNIDKVSPDEIGYFRNDCFHLKAIK